MRRRTGGTAAVPSSAVSMRALPRLVVAQCALPARSTSHDLLPKLLIHPRRCLCSPRALSPIIDSCARTDKGVLAPHASTSASAEHHFACARSSVQRSLSPVQRARCASVPDVLTNWVCAVLPPEPPKCAAPPRAPEARARRLRRERARRPDRRRYRSGQLYPPTFSSSSSDAVQEPGRAFECADCC